MKNFVIVIAIMWGLISMGGTKFTETKWEKNPVSYTHGTLIKCPHCSFRLGKPKTKLSKKEYTNFVKSSKKIMDEHIKVVHSAEGQKWFAEARKRIKQKTAAAKK